METDLQAGRGTDKVIGERIMGYTIYHYDKGYTPYWMLMDEEFEAVAQYPWNQRSSEGIAWSEDCPHFSTDLNAAFMVAAKIQQDFYFRFSLLGHEKGYWHAEFFGHPDPAQNSGQRWGDMYAS